MEQVFCLWELFVTIWAASGGFAALVEALNVAHDLRDHRSFLHRRLLAIGLALSIGTLIILAMAFMVVGPGFGTWLANKAGAGTVVTVWPYLRWVICVACPVLSIELIYAWGPCVRLSATLNPARGVYGPGYMARFVQRARVVPPQLHSPEQDIRDSGRRYRSDVVALLDGIFDSRWR